ncbi:TMV resistance protein N [Morella rubra]|uniref:ADP-ribosyl cyclase/cyclic ADP-ribose hydrolase n=1 Tax=Morella rubra TaxID=262757 RepID=A0A6A1UGU9_9ROSI|nr:TMV resistance protein N [Morella rubra]
MLRNGVTISPAHVKTIEESRISIIIFSENYASSTWCLDELIIILECRKMKKQHVLPVFYGVDPSHVRNQTKSFEKPFADLKERFKNDIKKVQRWRKALREVAGYSGFHWKKETKQSDFIQGIVEDITERLNTSGNLGPSTAAANLDMYIADIRGRKLFAGRERVRPNVVNDFAEIRRKSPFAATERDPPSVVNHFAEIRCRSPSPATERDPPRMVNSNTSRQPLSDDSSPASVFYFVLFYFFLFFLLVYFS